MENQFQFQIYILSSKFNNLLTYMIYHFMLLIPMEWFNMISYVFQSIIFNIFNFNLNLNIFFLKLPIIIILFNSEMFTSSWANIAFSLSHEEISTCCSLTSTLATPDGNKLVKQLHLTTIKRVKF